MIKRALADREGAPLLTRQGWAANAELLMRVAPHARRADQAPVEIRYTRRRTRHALRRGRRCGKRGSWPGGRRGVARAAPRRLRPRRHPHRSRRPRRRRSPPVRGGRRAGDESEGTTVKGIFRIGRKGRAALAIAAAALVAGTEASAEAVQQRLPFRAGE